MSIFSFGYETKGTILVHSHLYLERTPLKGLPLKISYFLCVEQFLDYTFFQGGGGVVVVKTWWGDGSNELLVGRLPILFNSLLYSLLFHSFYSIKF